MFGFVLIGALAAFGLVCAVWVLAGLFVPREKGRLVYFGPDPVDFARRYLWLREMGLLRCTLEVAEPEKEEEDWLESRGIKRYCREQTGWKIGENGN